MTKWQIFTAVALRRLPELLPRKTMIERKVQEIFLARELASSKFSNHEMEQLKDKQLAAEESGEVILKETAQDKEDRWNKEMASFNAAEHVDRLSLVEYLFKRQRFGSDIKDQWLLPQAEYDSSQDEHLLDTGRRALREALNIVNGYKIVSKIPSSVYAFRYPRKIVDQTGFKGARVFFLKAHLDMPSDFVLSQTNQTQFKDLKWLTKDEAFAEVHRNYMVSFSNGLLHENPVDANRILQRVTAARCTAQANQ